MQNVPSIHKNIGVTEWPTKNLKIYQNSLQKRQGYVQDRDLGTGVEVQSIILYQLSSGSRFTVYLTATDACKRESNGSWSYITKSYTTGTVTSIDDNGTPNSEVQGSSTLWDTGGNVAIGDYYITGGDHTSTAEPDANWAKIGSITDDTEVVLESSYTGSDESGAYVIRRQYAVPSRERWTHAIVNDLLIFCNGGDDVQYWDGSASYASSLDSTNAVKARYCLEFADRCILADSYVSGNRAPFTVTWSKNGDPTNWTHATAGSVDLQETEDYITGLGRVGPNMVVYKRDSFIIASRTSISTDPIDFGIHRIGIGCVAPYSIVPVIGTNAFLGRDDFYIIDGTNVKPIGEGIRHKFFELIGETEVENTWGYTNALQNEVRWFALGSDGTQYCFVWNYKTNEWYYYDYAHTMSCGGRGEA